MKKHQSIELSEQSHGRIDQAEKPSVHKIKSSKNTAINDKLRAIEYGGQKGPEPTRYGDWEKAGRCTDF